MCFFVRKVTGFPLLSKSCLLYLDARRKKGLTNGPICCHGFLLSDKMFPALGFGAQLPPDWKVCVFVVVVVIFVCVCARHAYVFDIYVHCAARVCDREEEEEEGLSYANLQ